MVSKKEKESMERRVSYLEEQAKSLYSQLNYFKFKESCPKGIRVNCTCDLNDNGKKSSQADWARSPRCCLGTTDNFVPLWEYTITAEFVIKGDYKVYEVKLIRSVGRGIDIIHSSVDGQTVNLAFERHGTPGVYRLSYHAPTKTSKLFFNNVELPYLSNDNGEIVFIS